MPVIDTHKWLDAFEEACGQQLLKDPYFIQCETVCGPLEQWFSEISKEELHYHLLMYGLFTPQEREWAAASVRKLKDREIWKLVKAEYEKLKKRWNGPEIPIFIFPISNVLSIEKKQALKKNGVAFKKAIVLFLSPDLKAEEVKAALAHEYNHACRLTHLNLKEEKITLKEALIIEGLGEYAVKELYGERWLAPWIFLYEFKEAVEIWEKYFVPSLAVEGKEKYDRFLFGKGDQILPKWIGYHIGYHIIHSYQEVHGPFNNNELYTKSSEELIRGSAFSFTL